MKILIVDGMAVLFRAYYATSYSGYIRKTSTGIPTNAIYGFLQYFSDAIQTFTPSHVICCWDMGSTTFRNEKFTDYKKNRDEAPPELVPQFAMIKEVLAEMGVPNVGIAGYEADDCIGTLSKRLQRDAEVYILTGDHDLLQLLDEGVKVVMMKKGRSNYAVYDVRTLYEEKQLTPEQIVDLKGFMGDTSDNYPGVKGIGEKTALRLLLEYKSIEGVLDNLEHLPKGLKVKIESDMDMLHLSRDLARIRLDVPMECDLQQCQWSVRQEAAIRKFEQLEMSSLIKLFH